MDLKEFYFQNIKESEYHHRFLNSVKKVNYTYNLFTGEEETQDYQFEIYDVEEAITKFKELCQLELHQTVMLMVKRELDVLLCDCGCGAFRQLPLQGLGLVQRTFPLIHSEALHTRVFGRFDAAGRGAVDAFASAASTMRACSS